MRWPNAIRRTTVLATIAAATIGGMTLSDAGTPVNPTDHPDRQGRQITLRDQLRTGLKAFTQADFDFIDLVVLRVEQGTLPRNLVDSTFLWARRRVSAGTQQYSKRPMVYFRPALVQRARALRIDL